MSESEAKRTVFTKDDSRESHRELFMALAKYNVAVVGRDGTIGVVYYPLFSPAANGWGLA